MLSPGSLFMELSCFNILLQICSFCSMRKEAINKTNNRHLYKNEIQTIFYSYRNNYTVVFYLLNSKMLS